MKSDWSLALDSFRQLPALLVIPSISSYAAISIALPKSLWTYVCSLLREISSSCLRLNTICLNAAVHRIQWSAALSLWALTNGIPNRVTLNSIITACERGRRWQDAGNLLKRMMQLRIANEVSIGAWVSTCGKSSRWGLALEACRTAEVRSQQAVNAAISCCEKAAQWPFALCMYRHFRHLHSHRTQDVIGQNAAISACEKGSCWKSALILLQTEVPDVISYSAAISASGRAQRWKIAVKLLEEMSEKKSLPNAVSFGAASVACVSKQWRWSLFLAGCNYSGKRERSSEQTEIAWRSAKQVSRRPSNLNTPDLTSIQELQPKELSTLVWSYAALNSFASFDLGVWPRIEENLKHFKCADLARLAWGFSSNPFPNILDSLQKEYVLRMETEKTDAVSALTLVWACSYAGCLRSETAVAIGGALETVGRSFGELRIPMPIISCDCIGPTEPTTPRIIREFSNFLVLQKPSKYQVDDGLPLSSAEPERGLLSFFLKAMFPKHPVLHDVDHSRGFLHRLDVPSSGLILVAKSHEAWYKLKMQAATGDVVRDYVALNHGWLSERQEVAARVHWWPNGRRAPSAVADAGRVAQTNLKVSELY
ncbi:Pentatricopeptide repeat-containing protein At2g31400, partial [Durusdinium trenchii]